MKKLTFISIIATSVFMLFLFLSNSAFCSRKGIKIGGIVGSYYTDNDWGSWQKVSCYKGIEFRTVRGNEEEDGTFWWSVQFRNLYDQKVKFNYNITEPEKEEKVRREKLILDIWTLGANEDPEEDGNESPHAGNYTHSSDEIFVFITNVRLSSDGNWDVPYIKCDK